VALAAIKRIVGSEVKNLVLNKKKNKKNFIIFFSFFFFFFLCGMVWRYTVISSYIVCNNTRLPLLIHKDA